MEEIWGTIEERAEEPFVPVLMAAFAFLMLCNFMMTLQYLLK